MHIFLFGNAESTKTSVTLANGASNEARLTRGGVCGWEWSGPELEGTAPHLRSSTDELPSYFSP